MEPMQGETPAPVWVYDPKEAGLIGLQDWPDVQIVATTVEDQIVTILRAWDLMEERQAALADRSSEEDFARPSAGCPPCLAQGDGSFTHGEVQQGPALIRCVATLTAAFGLHAAFYLLDFRNVWVVALAVTCLGLASWGLVGTVKTRAARSFLPATTFALAGGLCLAVTLRPVLGLLLGN